MKMYSTIRLDKLSEDDTVSLSNYLDSIDASFVVYEEIADKTKKVHFQGYIECTQETYEVYKEAFLVCFRKTHSRYQRSFTVVRKVESYMKYVAKDKKLFKSKGFTEQHIKEQEEKSYKKNEKKLTFQEVVDEWWNVVKPKYVWRNDYTIWDVNKMYKMLRIELVDQFKTLKKLWDLPIIERYCNYLINDVVPTEILLKYLDEKRGM